MTSPQCPLDVFKRPGVAGENQFARHCFSAGIVWIGHLYKREADAELGHLASEGYIDTVQTTDSDIFLFRAPTVIYVPQKKTDGPNITIYTSEDLFTNPSISLTRGGMLLIALLCGGDYDEGITGCGLESAHAVAQGDLGDALLHEALCNTTLTNGFLEFVLSWKERLCLEFAEDPRGLLGRKCKAIAATIAQSPSFPDPAVIFAYVHPITSWSPGYSLPDHHSWGLARPNL
ncbi:hypothetical protein DFH07DRAFT_964993 [Mycena maculata]|uniref:XPG-I domain-containing protein n=1 Tax=Mycena maculata TaxID=230809 RepID=A0AAD7IFE0_9AGAR|nr:hypothetical protein DFH07DRAFT_964993 [Mycena maculata]